MKNHPRKTHVSDSSATALGYVRPFFSCSMLIERDIVLMMNHCRCTVANHCRCTVGCAVPLAKVGQPIHQAVTPGRVDR